MADWRKLSLALVVADGRIDTRETNILRKELFADGKIDKSELEFLAACRKYAQGTVQAFDDLYIDAIKSHMLADGVITDSEAKWLRKTFFADGKIDATEKKLLQTLKDSAKSTCPEFEALCQECLK